MDLVGSYRVHKRPPLVPNVSQASQTDFFKIHFNIIIIPSTPRCSKQSLSFGFPRPTPCMHISFPHTCNKPRPTHSSSLDHSNIWW